MTTFSLKTWRNQVGVAAVVAVLVVGCSSSTPSPDAHPASSSAAPAASPAPAAPAAAHGGEAAIADVPWSQVGPGWTLATWSPAIPHRPGAAPDPNEDPNVPTRQTAATTLYLVDPAGNRYSIATFPAPGDKSGPELIDWSGDGSHALFLAEGYPSTTAISVDLHTGAQTTIPVHGIPQYTRPDGTAILASTSFNGNEPGTLTRLDLSGHEQQAYPTEQLGGAGEFSGSYLESPDGTQLVLGTANLGNEVVSRSDNSLVVMGNDGTIVRTLPSPMAKGQCSPVKWWTPTVILANCSAELGSGSQLWEVPLDGGVPTALTAFNSGQEDDPGFGEDIGDGTAWELPSGTFLQSAGACGTMFLSRLTPDMHTTRVTVPGVTGDGVVVAGATADKLILLGKVGCGGTTSLLTYDPAANTSTVLLGPPVNGGGVTEALSFPEEK
jgi:TolB protein